MNNASEYQLSHVSILKGETKMKKRLMAMVCTAIMALSMLAGTAMADTDSTDGV